MLRSIAIRNIRVKLPVIAGSGFAVLEIIASWRILAGRFPAIVNRALAGRLWLDQLAVGQVPTFPRSGGDGMVIGVVDDVRCYGPAEPSRSLAYLPLAQRVFLQAFLHARSAAAARVTLEHVRRVLADLDPEVPLSGAGTLRDKVDEALARWRAPALLAGLLALVTLVPTMGGLYAVLTMTVSQRTRELAIRVALGTRETSLRWMVLAEGLPLVAAGAFVGLVVAVPLMRLLGEPALRRRSPRRRDGWSGGLIGLVAAGALACDMATRRAVPLDTSYRPCATTKSRVHRGGSSDPAMDRRHAGGGVDCDQGGASDGAAGCGRGAGVKLRPSAVAEQRLALQLVLGRRHAGTRRSRSREFDGWGATRGEWTAWPRRSSGSAAVPRSAHCGPVRAAPRHPARDAAVSRQALRHMRRAVAPAGLAVPDL